MVACQLATASAPAMTGTHQLEDVTVAQEQPKDPRGHARSGIPSLKEGFDGLIACYYCY
jgi:hypothetical protein